MRFPDFERDAVKIDDIVVVLGLDPRIQTLYFLKRIWIPAKSLGTTKNNSLSIFTKSQLIQ